MHDRKFKPPPGSTSTSILTGQCSFRRSFRFHSRQKAPTLFGVYSPSRLMDWSSNRTCATVFLRASACFAIPRGRSSVEWH